MRVLRILVVDDEAHNREAIGDVLRRLGHEVALSEGASDALAKLGAQSFDLVLSDVRMPGLDGIDFFRAARRLLGEERLPAFAFMTAYGRLNEAVEAMRLGAVHFLAKPIRKKDLETLIQETLQKTDAAHRDVEAAPAVAAGEPVYVSRAFADVVQTVDRVASSLANVLFVGESGVGKEVLARRLHEKSGRSKGPFVAFHSGAVPETLAESELFGFVKGAFTGADREKPGLITQAHTGTFFLDEVSTMPQAIQAKLLRVLQDRQVQRLGAVEPESVDVRWAAATNVDLNGAVERSEFRQDLLYRLSVVVIEIPPLRNRPEDVMPLAQAFLKEISKRDSKEPLKLTDEVSLALQAHAWPGNVRELRNVVERAVALATGNEFTTDLLPSQIAQSEQAREVRIAVGSSLQSAEDKLIEETLRMCGGDKVQAAAILGVAPRTIYRWLEKR